jgi:mRNA (guanine-N7-)-methyltransferase
MDAGGPLPPNWVTAISKSSGKMYYFNTKTNQSLYERPPFPAAPPVALQAPAPSQPVSASNSFAMGPPAKRARTDDADGPVVDESLRKSLEVANSYASHEDVGFEGRNASKIFHLRGLNNWVKATLISHCVPKPARRVLDLACGKLGDWMKWKLADVEEYCGIDIAGGSIRAVARFATYNTNGQVVAKFGVADLGITDVVTAGLLEPDEQFDVISIQFALHYLFQTEARALTFFSNLRNRLKPGGVFIGTIPDAAYLVRRLRDEPEESTGFGNSIYSVKFSKEAKARQYAIGDDPYGIDYNFFLAESVSNVEEYLVPFPLLERLAIMCGFQLLVKENFHDFWEKMHALPQYQESFRRMKPLDIEGTISAEVNNCFF